MNSSAKITVSFLAAAALGAAVVFTGCTTSTTVNDTDGGTSTNDSGPSTGDTGTGGDTGTTPTTCTKKAASVFSNDTKCQSCLDTKCCTVQQTCFNIASEDGGTKLDCNGYVDCIDDCTLNKTGAELEACYTQCDGLAGTGVQTAYEGIVDCAEKDCTADCAGETPDGG